MHQHAALSRDCEKKLSILQQKGFLDNKLNSLKLSIYNNDINKVIKYYKKDKFCSQYSATGKCKNGNHCKQAHYVKISDLLQPNSKKLNYTKARLFSIFNLHYK